MTPKFEFINTMTILVFEWWNIAFPEVRAIEEDNTAVMSDSLDSCQSGKLYIRNIFDNNGS